MSAPGTSLLKIAPPYDEELIGQITRGFSEKLGAEVRFQVAEDPSLLCGFVAYVYGTVYDVSGKVQLVDIREHLVDSVILPPSAEIEEDDD